MKQIKNYCLPGVVIVCVICLLLTASTNSSSGKKQELIEDANLSQFNKEDITIGVASGYIFEETAQRTLPNATIRSFENREALYKALELKEIDAVCDDEPIIRSVMRSIDWIDMVPGYLEESDYAFTFPKTDEGEKLRKQMNKYLKEIEDSGQLKKLDKKWFGKSIKNKKSDDATKLKNEKGELTIAYDDSNIPFAYDSAGEPVGYEIDIAIGFCEKYGYALKLKKIRFSDMLDGVANNQYSAGCGAITITDKRKEDHLFSSCDYSGGIALAINNGGKVAIDDAETNHFKAAFVDNDRYKVFFGGIGTTVLISLLAIFFGLPFGIIIFIISRRSLVAIKAFIKGLVWVVDGLPAIMILMLVYYTYYYNLQVGGYIASVIGFTLIFGCNIYSIILRYAMEIGHGALERDFRLESIEVGRFFGVLIKKRGPQLIADARYAASELIKSTSVVGLIAVSDMTKVFDAIRTESLETMIPLIATILEYLVLIKVVRGHGKTVKKGRISEDD